MEQLVKIGKAAKSASYFLNSLTLEEKDNILKGLAKEIIIQKEVILAANEVDLNLAKDSNMNKSLLDRLMINEDRLTEMSNGLIAVSELSNPLGEVLESWVNADGLNVQKVRVPLGVIGIIYEARPNVTTDAAGLCFKTGNAVILRGGKEAFNTNLAIINALQTGLSKFNIPKEAIQLVTNTSREVAQQFMQLNEYLDVLIPRGGAGLIQAVLKNATVPVIETGTGNCHIFIDKSANLDQAVDIVYNAKCQRPSVCNACETILVHEAIASEFLPKVEAKLKISGVEMRADEGAITFLKDAVEANEIDWSTEYNDYIIAVKLVNNVSEAIDHINCYNTKHSESIITEDKVNAERFMKEVDAAAVYVNASTRFTDGFVFGFGAEIGISTQKLHARGPMGLTALTSYKYLIQGTGQIRQ